MRYVVGFGIGTGLGLAPYLGVLDVPLFKPLLTLIPEAIQDTAIPLSAALMGTLAAAIQWYSEESPSRKRLSGLFKATLLLAMATFVLLAVVHTLTVVPIHIGEEEIVSMIVGFNRPVKEPCMGNVSDEQCVKILTMDPAAISSFWGDRGIRIARLSLMFAYLLFTGLFSILVGLIVLRESNPPSSRE